VNPSNSKYSSYRVSGLPAGPFGETYLIVVVINDSNRLKRWEYFLISKRSKPNLQKSACSYETSEDLDESLEIDEEFLVEEAKQQAAFYLEDALEEIASSSSRPFSFDYKVEFLNTNTSPLHSLWFRGELHDEIRDIAQSTECKELKFYLEILVKSSFVRRPR